MIKHFFILFILAMFQQSCTDQTAPNTQKASAVTAEEVAIAVEDFRLALLDPKEDKLLMLTDSILSYGHSSGMIEDQTTFITSLLTAKFKFTDLSFVDQTISLSQETAIVRHSLLGKSQDQGKEPGDVRLHVLLVWQKKEGQLRLLARQAVKI